MTSIVQRFTENDLETVVCILQDFFSEKDMSISDIPHVKTEVLSSVFV